ncbi:patched domain-containing protein 3 [Babesia caballi]|uniref:Patched domain-containing protein 3 n=1 Tax=Babesia caballi TaxID=5871 RepID=A0AAV4LZE2_BABCB|nr:patched domain-containing protein 3 [Babesia caballi]
MQVATTRSRGLLDQGVEEGAQDGHRHAHVAEVVYGVREDDDGRGDEQHTLRGVGHGIGHLVDLAEAVEGAVVGGEVEDRGEEAVAENPRLVTGRHLGRRLDPHGDYALGLKGNDEGQGHDGSDQREDQVDVAGREVLPYFRLVFHGHLGENGPQRAGDVGEHGKEEGRKAELQLLHRGQRDAGNNWDQCQEHRDDWLKRLDDVGEGDGSETHGNHGSHVHQEVQETHGHEGDEELAHLLEMRPIP